MLAGAGYVEALNYPFIGEHVFDQLGLAADDPKRKVVKLVNPLSDEEPALRTTLLPGLLHALRRNDGRGSHDLALFETGLVFQPQDELRVAGRLPVDRRPTDEEIASSRPRSPSSPGTPPSSSRAPASRPAGGARAARPTGPTRSRPRARWPARRGPNSSSVPGSTGRGTRVAAPNWPSSSTARRRSSGTPVSCTPVS